LVSGEIRGEGVLDTGHLHLQRAHLVVGGVGGELLSHLLVQGLQAVELGVSSAEAWSASSISGRISPFSWSLTETSWVNCWSAV